MGSRLESNSNAVRKRIEKHTFDDEEGEEYEGSAFGGFSEYFRRKKIKLQNLDAERRARNSDKPQIFRGVVAQVNGYTQPSLNDLHKMIVDYGGGFLQYLDGKTMCTHIIAANLTPKKREEFKNYRVVKPAWVVDSIKAGKLQPWDNYRVIDDIKGQQVIGFQGGKVVSQSGAQDRRSYKEQTDTSWYADQVRSKASSVDGDLAKQTPERAEAVYRASVIPLPQTEGHIVAEAPIVEDTIDRNTELGENFLEIGTVQPETDVDAEPGEPDSSTRIDTRVHVSQRKPSGLAVKDLRPDDLGEGPRPGNSGNNKKPLTAEEHNAVILADPRRWKSTVVNPDFMKQYFEESRLHHLSTWKAELKSQLQALALEQSSSQKARQRRPKGARQYVLHVDFDSFFVAVSVLKHPEFKDSPAVVAHGGGSGSEIASCNYPARQFGVKNGMWMKRAQELCPNLKILPYDFKAYEDASRKFYEVIMKVGGVVQSVSVDEALLDVSVICIEAGGSDGREKAEDTLCREQQKADEIGQQIRDDIKELTGCAVSVGIGANILQAKLALRKAKPAGQFQLRPDEVLDFIGPLSVQDLPGVAYSTGNKLEEVGIKCIKDIRESTKDRLMSTLGPKTGEKLWEYARGIDHMEVGEQVVRKSVSAEVNWGIRFATQEQAEEFIRSICEELEKRLLNEAVKGRQFSLKIMRRARDAPLDPPKHMGHGKCDVFNKSVVLGVATNDKAVLSREALSILRGFGFPPGELRGIGVQVTKLEPLKKSKILPESSQRMLNFGKAVHSPVQPQESDHADTDTPKTRRTVTFADAENAFNAEESTPTSKRIPVLKGEDEIDSPHKNRMEDRLGLVTPQKLDEMTDDSILNTTGTQFILPSQADPEVVAALPEDIRTRFARASAIAREKQENKDKEFQMSEMSDSVEEWNIDPETLAALPDDIREEVLAQHRAQYNQRGSPRPDRQAVLPQSPRPSRSLRAPVKRPRARRGGLSSRGRGHASLSSGPDIPTLTQANFVIPKSEKEEIQDDSDCDTDEVPPDVLNALPADIRAEVIEQQQRDRLRRKGAIDVVKRKKRSTIAPGAMVQRTLEFAPRPPRPTFTARKLSSLPELREAVSAWFESTRNDDGVEMDDVEALSGYLRRVVIDEKDMHKATAVVKWLIWLVDENGQEAGRKWRKAVSKLTDDVQHAVTERGLGKIEF